MYAPLLKKQGVALHFLPLLHHHHLMKKNKPCWKQPPSLSRPQHGKNEGIFTSLQIYPHFLLIMYPTDHGLLRQVLLLGDWEIQLL